MTNYTNKRVIAAYFLIVLQARACPASHVLIVCGSHVDTIFLAAQLTA